MSDDSVVLWSRSVLLPVALAIIAAEGGSHGYRIKQLMEQGGFQRPVDGALYPMLRTAEAEGLLESSWQKGSASLIAWSAGSPLPECVASPPNVTNGPLSPTMWT